MFQALSSQVEMMETLIQQKQEFDDQLKKSLELAEYEFNLKSSEFVLEKTKLMEKLAKEKVHPFKLIEAIQKQKKIMESPNNDQSSKDDFSAFDLLNKTFSVEQNEKILQALSESTVKPMQVANEKIESMRKEFTNLSQQFPSANKNSTSEKDSQWQPPQQQKEDK